MVTRRGIPFQGRDNRDRKEAEKLRREIAELKKLKANQARVNRELAKLGLS